MGQIVWYSDDELIIRFDSEPDLDIRYPEPNSTKEEIKKIKQKPFICNKDLFVTIVDQIEQEEYGFLIEKGYTWDGATIPRFCWFFVGPRTDNRFLVPSLIHDVLCENHEYIDNNRYLSTSVFDACLCVSRVNPLTRFIMKHSVDNAQKFIGGW